MNRFAVVGSVILTGVVVAACGGGGGGGGSGSAQSTPVSSPATAPASVGLWKGTATTGTSEQPQEAVGTVSQDGQFHMTFANGMTFVGTMQASGSSFSMAMTAYMPAGQTFPNGAQSAAVTFSGSMSSAGMMSGSYNGGGQSGTFAMTMDQMGLRPASLQSLAGTYTRSNGSGYTITMTIGANGQVTGSDTQGCVFSGTVTVPSASRNLYGMNMTVTSCGAMNGSYTGTGTLVDASSMTSWMSSMRTSMMSGAMMGGRNVIPTGTSNLFMFALSNGQRAIADSLYR